MHSHFKDTTLSYTVQGSIILSTQCDTYGHNPSLMDTKNFTIYIKKDLAYRVFHDIYGFGF